MQLGFEEDAEKSRYTWSLVGPDGGVHIWAQLLPEDSLTRHMHGSQFYGGVECHWKKPVYENQEVSQEHCWLLNGPCYHDGSSLYFSERIAPTLSLENIKKPHTTSYIQSVLLSWYEDRIEERQ